MGEVKRKSYYCFELMTSLLPVKELQFCLHEAKWLPFLQEHLSSNWCDSSDVKFAVLPETGVRVEGP